MRLGLGAFLLGGLMAASPAMGQGKGVLFGIVKDDFGKLVEGALVTLRQLYGPFVPKPRLSKPDPPPPIENPPSFQTRTGKDGTWHFIGLGSGTWEVHVSAQGHFTATSTCRVTQLYKNPIVVMILSRIPPLPRQDSAEIALLERANNAYYKRDYSEAIGLFRQYADKQPDYEMVFLMIAECLKEKGDLDPAIAEYQAVADRTARDPLNAYLTGLAFAGIAECHWRRRQVTQSEEYFRRALKVSETNPYWAYNLAELISARGAIAEAIAAYEIAVRLDGTWSDPVYKLGLARLRMGEEGKAMDSFRAFLKLEPRTERSKLIRKALKELEKKGLP